MHFFILKSQYVVRWLDDWGILVLGPWLQPDILRTQPRFNIHTSQPVFWIQLSSGVGTHKETLVTSILEIRKKF
jgi:hypothetical protein